MRRLNRYVEEHAPWALARDAARAAELERVLASLAEGLRVVTVALDAVHARQDGDAARRARAPPTATERAFAATGWGGRVAAIPPLFPKTRMIDSHTHLDACEPPDAELVAAARRPPASRGSSPSAPTRTSCRAALAAAESLPDGLGGDRLPPAQRRGARRGAPARARRRTRAASAIGETGLDYYRDRAPRDAQRRAFEAQIELARALDKPLVIHSPRRRARTRSTLLERRAGGPAGDPALLLDARAARPLRRGGLVDLVRRQRHLPVGDRPRRAPRRACPPSGCWSRPTRPTSRRSRAAAAPNEPAAVVETAQFVAALRGVAPRRARGRARAQRRRAVPLVSEVTQPSLRRLAQFDVRPRRDLGQNFLVDSNILGVIERAAELEPRRRRARDRRRPRRALRVPRRARRGTST